jgi:hypothetical protein
MLRAYLSKKLTRPLPTKDGGTLRTVADARAYMLGLSKQRVVEWTEREHTGRARKGLP